MVQLRNDREDWLLEKQIKVENRVQKFGKKQNQLEVAAHTALHAKWTDEEKNALSRRGDESWIGIYQEFF